MRRQTRSPLQVSPRDFPEMPVFPEDMSKTKLEEYRRSQKEFWTKVKTLLTEMDAELQAK